MKKVILIISLVLVYAGSVGGMFLFMNSKYNNLKEDDIKEYNDLMEDYNSLVKEIDDLQADYDSLQNDYDTLKADYDEDEEIIAEIRDYFGYEDDNGEYQIYDASSYLYEDETGVADWVSYSSDDPYYKDLIFVNTTDDEIGGIYVHSSHINGEIIEIDATSYSGDGVFDLDKNGNRYKFDLEKMEFIKY